MTDEYTRALLRKSVALICRSTGWETAKPSALNVLSDMLRLYLQTICNAAVRYSELCGRKPVDLDSLLRSFRDYGLNMLQLTEYFLKAKPIKFGALIPMYPSYRASKLDFLETWSPENLVRPPFIHNHFPPIYRTKKALNAALNTAGVTSRQIRRILATKLRPSAPAVQQVEGATGDPGDESETNKPKFKRAGPAAPPRRPIEPGSPFAVQLSRDLRVMKSVEMCGGGVITKSMEGVRASPLMTDERILMPPPLDTKVARTRKKRTPPVPSVPSKRRGLRIPASVYQDFHPDQVQVKRAKKHKKHKHRLDMGHLIRKAEKRAKRLEGGGHRREREDTDDRRARKKDRAYALWRLQEVSSRDEKENAAKFEASVPKLRLRLVPTSPSKSVLEAGAPPRRIIILPVMDERPAKAKAKCVSCKTRITMAKASTRDQSKPYDISQSVETLTSSSESDEDTDQPIKRKRVLTAKGKLYFQHKGK